MVQKIQSFKLNFKLYCQNLEVGSLEISFFSLWSCPWPTHLPTTHHQIVGLIFWSLMSTCMQSNIIFWVDEHWYYTLILKFDLILTSNTAHLALIILFYFYHLCKYLDKQRRCEGGRPGTILPVIKWVPGARISTFSYLLCFSHLSKCIFFGWCHFSWDHSFFRGVA